MGGISNNRSIVYWRIYARTTGVLNTNSVSTSDEVGEDWRLSKAENKNYVQMNIHKEYH